MLKASPAHTHEDPDEAPRLTRDDEAARRIANLYLAFANSPHPLAFDEIHRDFYPGLTDAAALKAFQRDRVRLAQCGLIVRNAAENGADALWQVDEHRSYAESSALTPEEARVIDVACLPLASDPSFPQRSDLKSALAKIDRAFSGAAVLQAAPDATDRGSKAVLATLNRCLSLLHPVRATYVDAQGKASERVLEIWGSFGFRNRTYFVCAEELPHAEPDADPARPETGAPKTYLLDRFQKAEEVATRPGMPRGTQATYAIPEDFSVSDYKLLPFQIGDEDFELAALVPDEALEGIRPLARRAGTLEPLASWQQDGPGRRPAGRQDGPGRRPAGSPSSPDTDTAAARQPADSSARPSGPQDDPSDLHVWRVPARDAGRAASWCVAYGLTPLAPDAVVGAWRDLLKEASGND